MFFRPSGRALFAARRHVPNLSAGFFVRDVCLKTPKRLLPLLEEGLIDEVLGQLMSGKEATVYVVRSGDSTRCAKVYKDAKQRSFRQATSYLQGRTVQNSRPARAMEIGRATV